MKEVLYLIQAPHFSAGLITCGQTVIKAAPIIHWTVGKSIDKLMPYFKKKKWTALKVEEIIDEEI